MIFIDANIPMYILGADDGLKARALGAVERFAVSGVRFVSDAEVFQEIIHRYTALRRPEAVEPVFNALLSIVDEVFPIELVDVHHAKDLLAEVPGLSARDATHAAIMARHDVTKVLTFDTGFDKIRWIERISS